MKKTLLHPIYFLGLIATTTAVAQEQQAVDTLKTTALNEILVSSVRVTEKDPIAFENLSKSALSKRNLGQDIPTMMSYMTSVVSTTDAGNGIGYSSFRVRGTDATRVNVTLNGIPYNDGESQGTFWVNMPDFTSSVQNIQLQRGVGTSTNGSAAFGASLNLNTDNYAYDASGEIANSFGSYNTRKSTVKFSTGLINDKFEIAGRLSDMKSDGYIDRASSRMKSYFLQGAYLGKTSLVKALVFGGNQKTYQAWNGVSQEEIDEFGRRYNSAGKYKDENGQVQFYDNETDNYRQDHYQLHWSEKWSDLWSSNVSLHYTKGFGFYENYKRGQDLGSYGLKPVAGSNGTMIEESDLIRRKFLDNHFYGMVFNANYTGDKISVILGGAANKYEGDHFGDILWVKEPVDYKYKQEYYRDHSVKTDMNFYTKANWQFANQWNLYGDLQYRRVTYEANGQDTGLVNEQFNFFNPKAGIIYQLDAANQFYLSYARANREPNRTDYEERQKNVMPKHEQLDDFELGWRYKGDRAEINVNAYYMKYKDQLVLTGQLNDVGANVRENIADSYRLGLEIDANVRVLDQLHWSPSIAISSNKNRNLNYSWAGEMKNFGNTSIAFSPDFVASNAITYLPMKGMSVSLLTKFVGEQYMSNIETETSKLDSYFVNDLSVNYEFPIKGWVKGIQLSVLANNIFNTKYISNGYYWTAYDGGSNTMYDGAGYYPQAEFNILGGVTIKF